MAVVGSDARSRRHRRAHPPLPHLHGAERPLRNRDPTRLRRRNRRHARRTRLRHPARPLHWQRLLRPPPDLPRLHTPRSRAGNARGARGHYTDLARHQEDAAVPGLVIVRPESGLFFANADHVRNQIRDAVARSKPHAVILDAETMPYIDVTAITILEQLAGDLERNGTQLVLARDIGTVRDVLDRAQDTNATLATYPTVQAAVDALTK